MELTTCVGEAVNRAKLLLIPEILKLCCESLIIVFLLVLFQLNKTQNIMAIIVPMSLQGLRCQETLPNLPIDPGSAKDIRTAHPAFLSWWCGALFF
jgi:hypothetical protein